MNSDRTLRISRLRPGTRFECLESKIDTNLNVIFYARMTFIKIYNNDNTYSLDGLRSDDGNEIYDRQEKIQLLVHLT